MFDFLRLEFQAGSDWQTINLPDDISITIQETSPLWSDSASTEYSFPFKIDIDNNLHFFGNSAELNGANVSNLVDGIRFRLFADGNLFKTGLVHIDNDMEIQYEDNGHRTVEVNLESGNKDIDTILDGVKIRDIDLEKYAIQIGYCLPDELPIHGEYDHIVYGRREVTNNGVGVGNNGVGVGKYQYYYYPTSSETVHWDNTISMPITCVVNYHDNQHNGQYTHNFVNVQHPYNPNNPLEHPYCNVRVCYMKCAWDDESKQWKKERETSVGEPDRVNSAPCFYFGFVHDVLLQSLGIGITYNALNDILDYKRLAFFHYNCAYKAVPIPNKTFAFNNDINGIKFHVEYRSGRQYRQYFSNKNDTDWAHSFKVSRYVNADYPLCKAIATSDNLPDKEAKDLIEAVRTAFGARYIYDNETKNVKIILLRDVLADNTVTSMDNIIEVTGNIVKTENTTSGIVFKYSASKDADRNTITNEEYLVSGNDDTTFNYNDYRFPYVIGYGLATWDDTTQSLIYDQTDTPVNSYYELVDSVSDRDLRLYIDPTTSNAYRIKVDQHAETQSDWHPSLIQVAAYRDVKIGDTLEDNTKEKNIETITIPFTPCVPNLANFHQQWKAIQSSGETVAEDNSAVVENDTVLPDPIYAQYIDEEIHHKDDDELIERLYIYNGIALAYLRDWSTGHTNVSAHVDVNLKIWQVEDYEVSSSSLGPYGDSEPEFALGIMRGSGSDAHTVIYDDNYDGEGHSHYTMVSGSNAEFLADTMDNNGAMFDYNGEGSSLRTITKAQARAYLLSYFSDSNVDLLALNVAYYAAIRNSGWTGYDGEGTARILLFSPMANDSDENNYIFLLTAIDSIGSVYSRSGLSGYLDNLSLLAKQNKTSIMREDAEHDNLIIARYDLNQYDRIQTMWDFLNGLVDIYYGNEETGQLLFPDNGLGYTTDDLISLRLKSEIPIDGDPDKGYYPVTNPMAQSRGLADKFYGTYFHWLMNAKTATIPCIMQASVLKKLDWTTRYKIGGITGFISKKSYTITQKGIDKITIEEKYL